MALTIFDFPIVDDPSAAWESGPPYEGLYGRETMQHALCLDFDGVLHSYESGWVGHEEVADGPVPGAVQACHDLADAGWALYVMTSRSNLAPVQRWLIEQGFPPMKLTRVKPIAVAYIDDRAVRFEGDWPSVRKLFA